MALVLNACFHAVPHNTDRAIRESYGGRTGMHFAGYEGMYATSRTRLAKFDGKSETGAWIHREVVSTSRHISCPTHRVRLSTPPHYSATKDNLAYILGINYRVHLFTLRESGALIWGLKVRRSQNTMPWNRLCCNYQPKVFLEHG